MVTVECCWKCVCWVLFLCTSFQLVLTEWFEPWARSDFPNPELEPESCGRTEPSHVCDPDSILQEFQANKLDEMISEVMKLNKCACADESLCDKNSHLISGYPLKIALLKNISISKSLEEDGQGFADYLRSKWSFGSCDNSIIVLFIQFYHKVFISSGKAATNQNELLKFKNNLRDSYPKFEDLQSLVQNIIDILYIKLEEPKTNALPLWIIVLIASAAVLMVLLLAFIVCKKCRIKSTPSTAGLPWEGTRVKIFNFGFWKKNNRNRRAPQKY